MYMVLATRMAAGSGRGRPGRKKEQGPRLSCAVSVKNDTFITVKQSQFTKLTSEPHVRNPEESNETFDRAIRE